MSRTSSTKGPRGKNAVDRLLAGRVLEGRPLMFLDIDGVLCHGNGYDSYNVDPRSPPLDLWGQTSRQTLLTIVEEFRPWVIISSSWQKVMNKEELMFVFRATGLREVADALHPRWSAAQSVNDSRLQAIQRWLFAHYEGGHLAVVDDVLSGTGLRGSALDRAGRVVLCEPARGLGSEHLPALRGALACPVS